MPPQIIPPEPLQRALERGLCEYTTLTVSATVPPGMVKMAIYPSEDAYCWRLFCLVFGDLSPIGTSPDFIVRHVGPHTILHDDPWVWSIVSRTYPLTETITQRNPHTFWFINNTGADQTFDLALHAMEFKTIEDWNRYRALCEEGAAVVNLLKGIAKVRRS